MKYPILVNILFICSCSSSFTLEISNATSDEVQISIISDEFECFKDTTWNSLNKCYVVGEIVTTPWSFEIEKCQKAKLGDSTVHYPLINEGNNRLTCYESFVSLEGEGSNKLTFTLQEMQSLPIYGIPDAAHLDFSSIDTIHIRFRNDEELIYTGSKAIWDAIVKKKGAFQTYELRIGEM